MRASLLRADDACAFGTSERISASAREPAGPSRSGNARFRAREREQRLTDRAFRTDYGLPAAAVALIELVGMGLVSIVSSLDRAEGTEPSLKRHFDCDGRAAAATAERHGPR